MDLIRLTYDGRKAYRDKLTGNTWAPGDTKLVPGAAGEKLLRFSEFKRYGEAAEPQTQEPAQPDANVEGDKPTDSELEAAMVVQQEAERAKEQEKQMLESMLLTVQSMDKSALEEYARKYEVELDKRLGVGKLRAEVATLIEQFGVR